MALSSAPEYGARRGHAISLCVFYDSVLRIQSMTAPVKTPKRPPACMGIKVRPTRSPKAIPTSMPTRPNQGAKPIPVGLRFLDLGGVFAPP